MMKSIVSIVSIILFLFHATSIVDSFSINKNNNIGRRRSVVTNAKSEKIKTIDDVGNNEGSVGFSQYDDRLSLGRRELFQKTSKTIALASISGSISPFVSPSYAATTTNNDDDFEVVVN